MLENGIKKNSNNFAIGIKKLGIIWFFSNPPDSGYKMKLIFSLLLIFNEVQNSLLNLFIYLKKIR